MNNFLLALQFLTIFPIKIINKIKEKNFGKSLLYFPFIGLLIGLLLVFVAFFFSFLPLLVQGILILIISIIITGAIHLDGFADTCDGFYAGYSKEKILSIMRDSHIGIMGTIGIICLLLFKFILIISFPQNILWQVLVLTSVFARFAQVVACYYSSYAREQGKAEYFIKYASKKELLGGGIFTLGLFLILMKLKGLLLFGLACLVTFLFINFVKRKIGGMTGDTLGATNEIAEITVLFFSLIYL